MDEETAREREKELMEGLVEKALLGQSSALEELIKLIKDDVYNLSLRMLWHPADAEDATQEILLRIITNLGQFERRASFKTWTYKIAANYLLTTRKRLAERRLEPLEKMESDMVAAPHAEMSEGERLILRQEVKIACTHGMLLFLDREHRLAFLLSVIFAVTSQEGAEILGISSDAYRKRVSRGKNRIFGFLQKKCGLIEGSNPCSCDGELNRFVHKGILSSKKLLFVTGKETGEVPLEPYMDEVDRLSKVGALYKSNPRMAASGAAVEKIKTLLASDRYKILNFEGEGK